MKLRGGSDEQTGFESHPAGVRGLKRWRKLNRLQEMQVAPRRGAWIETGQWTTTAPVWWVAPRRGAWIETYSMGIHLPFPLMSHPAGVRGLKLWIRYIALANSKSHPAGVRGLKLANKSVTIQKCFVAPRRGAWIETTVL